MTDPTFSVQQREFPPVFIQHGGAWIRRDLVAGVRTMTDDRDGEIVLLLDDQGEELLRERLPTNADVVGEVENLVMALCRPGPLARPTAAVPQPATMSVQPHPNNR